MEIYCGLCGQKAHQLFAHLRAVHELSADRYQERCPGAPLISEDLAAAAWDLFTNAKILRRARKEFKEGTAGFKYDPLVPKKQRPPVDAYAEA